MLSQRPHILFVSPGYPPLPGGGERFVRSLALELQKLGYEITVVTSSAETEAQFWQGTREMSETVEDGIKIHRLPIRPHPGGRNGLLALRKTMVSLSPLPGTKKTVVRMARFIPFLMGFSETVGKVPNPDLIHAFNLSWEYPAMVGWHYAHRQRIPLVLTPFAHFGENPKGRVARNSMMSHQRRMLRSSTAVLTLTDVEKKGMASWGVKPKVIRSIGSGLDPLPDQTAELEHLPKRFVLFLGRASHDKGAIHTAQACATAQIPLVMAGQPTPEFDSFWQKNQHIKKYVTRLGIVSEEKKHALLTNCDILLLPSRAESFGIVILEAWAYNKPVIAANAGSLPAIIDHNTNGIITPYGNVPDLRTALHDLWNNPQKRLRLGQNGHQKLQTHYQWPAVANKVHTTYTQIFNQKTTAGRH